MHWTPAKNSKTDFIEMSSVREGDFSIKLNSTQNTAKVAGYFQPTNGMRGSVHRKLPRGTSGRGIHASLALRILALGGQGFGCPGWGRMASNGRPSKWIQVGVLLLLFLLPKSGLREDGQKTEARLSREEGSEVPD